MEKNQLISVVVPVYNEEEALPLFYKQRYLFCKQGVKDVSFNPFTGQVQFSEAKFFD